MRLINVCIINVKWTAMSLNNSTYITKYLWQCEQGEHSTTTKITIIKHRAAWVNKGKKAPGMHIHKAISEGMERTETLLNMAT